MPTHSANAPHPHPAVFVIDGVNNMLKDLGPSVAVPYNGTKFYFTSYCRA